MAHSSCDIGGGYVAIKQVVGPSGSGLTQRLTALYESTAGAVMLTSDPRAHITYLRTTVEEELAFGLEQRGVSVPDMQRRIFEIAQALNLEELLDRAPNELSGGQTRRLALGTVLILDTPLVLLDDPFAGLDPSSREALSVLLHSLNADVVVAGHQPWMDGVETEFLGEDPTPQLPGRVAWPPRGRGAHDAAENDAYLHFSDVMGSNGTSSRRWWQFRKARSKHFEIGPVTLSAPRGGVLWLRGVNGAGKSTLMRALVKHPTHTDVAVGLMLQDPVDQVIDSQVDQMVTDAQLREQFGLESKEHPLDLSQSALRLAQFASVMSQNVDLLCADEPDVGLDIVGRNQLHAGFAAYLSSGGALILSCHDEGFIDEVRAYAHVEVHQLSK